jgi:hypothetical protein
VHCLWKKRRQQHMCIRIDNSKLKINEDSFSSGLHNKRKPKIACGAGSSRVYWTVHDTSSSLSNPHKWSDDGNNNNLRRACVLNDSFLVSMEFYSKSFSTSSLPFYGCVSGKSATNYKREEEKKFSSNHFGLCVVDSKPQAFVVAIYTIASL